MTLLEIKDLHNQAEITKPSNSEETFLEERKEHQDDVAEG